jgi:hypothetical protein
MKRGISLILFLLLICGATVNTQAQTITNDAGIYKFVIEPVDATEYNTLYKKYFRQEPQYEVVEDFEVAKDMLQGIATFDDEDSHLAEIKTREGKIINVLEENDYTGFLAYYPSLDILYLEGGHSSDVSYDLTTGESTELVGIPPAFLTSPNKKFRVSGYWSGQECSFYFIQEYKNGRFRKIGDIVQDDLCNTAAQFWVDDTTLYYELSDYMNESYEGSGKYYKLSIVKK